MAEPLTTKLDRSRAERDAALRDLIREASAAADRASELLRMGDDDDIDRNWHPLWRSGQQTHSLLLRADGARIDLRRAKLDHGLPIA
jgi:hypothetical protein